MKQHSGPLNRISLLILVVVLAAVFAVALLCVAREGFLALKSEEEKAMVASAMDGVHAAMISDPVEGWREDDPLHYFRPSGYEGRITGKTLEAFVMGSRLMPDGGEITVGVRKQNYFKDGPSDVMFDKVTLDVDRDDGGRWFISCVHVQP